MDASIKLISTRNTPLRVTRVFGALFGFGNQLLFLVTVWYLFWFLRDGGTSDAHDKWVLRDIELAMFFGFAHSLMLARKSRAILSRWIPSAFYDSAFCVVTCLSLLLLFHGWRSSQTVLWECTGIMYYALRSGFYLSWAALFYSLALTGLGYQNGWTTFYYWLRLQKPPRREFKPRGAYKLIRHPVYLSFLGLVWFTPRMTLDHAVLTAIWTGYIFYGSVLKDRRLEHFIGEPYRQYECEVTGYPLINRGPLGRRNADLRQ